MSKVVWEEYSKTFRTPIENYCISALKENSMDFSWCDAAIRSEVIKTSSPFIEQLNKMLHSDVSKFKIAEKLDEILKDVNTIKNKEVEILRTRVIKNLTFSALSEEDKIDKSTKYNYLVYNSDFANFTAFETKKAFESWLEVHGLEADVPFEGKSLCMQPISGEYTEFSCYGPLPKGFEVLDLCNGDYAKATVQLNPRTKNYMVFAHNPNEKKYREIFDYHESRNKINHQGFSLSGNIKSKMQLLKWFLDNKPLVKHIHSLNYNDTKKMHMECERDLILLKKNQDPLASDRANELKFIEKQLGYFKTHLDGEQYKLLVDFSNTIFGIKKDNQKIAQNEDAPEIETLRLDSSFWVEKLDSFNIPWELQNGIATLSDNLKNKQYYLSTLLKQQGVEVVKKLNPSFVDEELNAKVDNTVSNKNRFMSGFLGGADVTVWDRENEENGDYKVVATVNNGVISLREDYFDDQDAIKYIEQNNIVKTPVPNVKKLKI